MSWKRTGSKLTISGIWSVTIKHSCVVRKMFRILSIFYVGWFGITSLEKTKKLSTFQKTYVVVSGGIPLMWQVQHVAKKNSVMISGERTHLPISRLTFQGICNKLVIFHQAGFKSNPSAIFFYAVDTKRVTAGQKKRNISICVFVHVHICQTNDLKWATRNQNAVFTNVSEVIYSPLKSG